MEGISLCIVLQGELVDPVNKRTAATLTGEVVDFAFLSQFPVFHDGKDQFW